MDVNYFRNNLQNYSGFIQIVYIPFFLKYVIDGRQLMTRGHDVWDDHTSFIPYFDHGTLPGISQTGGILGGFPHYRFQQIEIVECCMKCRY